MVKLARLAAIFTAVAVMGAANQPSALLLALLAQIAHFDDASLLAISSWASYQNPQPPDTPLTDLDQVEVEAVKLAPAEQDALFAWLEHTGRSKLYALGVTDNQIGPCQPLIDQNGCKHPSPVVVLSATPRELSFRADAQADSGVEVSGGFVSVGADATSFTHCIAFKNTTQKTMAAITFTYKMLAPSGLVLGAGSDVVVGSFLAGSQTESPASLEALQSLTAGGGAAPENCWTKTVPPLDPALLHATVFSVSVASVTYEDGTHWSQ
jgi:hypothetical protein